MWWVSTMACGPNSSARKLPLDGSASNWCEIFRPTCTTMLIFAIPGRRLNTDRFGSDISLIIHAAAQPSHDWAASNPTLDFTVNANALVMRSHAGVCLSWPSLY